MTIAVTGSFSGTGQSASFTPVTPTDGLKPFNIRFSGTAVASVQLEASFDNGTTWCIIEAGGSQICVWSYTGTNFTEKYEETQGGVIYRLNCTSYTSGTLNYGLSS